MNLMTVRDYLETILPVEGIWFGVARMDAKKKHALCLYGAPVRTESGMKIGGMDCTGYQMKHMMLVLRGGENAVEAETAASAIHTALTRDYITIGGATGFMRALEDEPFSLGSDVYGVWEYRMDFELYYEL